MSERKKAILIGDLTDAPWHPLEPARIELESILREEFQLTSTEDYGRFATLKRDEFSLCISYTDCWNRELAPELAAGLLQYVAGGGGLLVVHNGISLQQRFELAQMIGAKFTGHPPYQPLSYVKTAEDHPLLEGVDNFSVDEEPYMFELDPLSQKTVFLEFEFEGARYPAAWELSYGLGKVVYLQPGHHAPSFKPEAYRRLLLNSARWCAIE